MNRSTGQHHMHWLFLRGLAREQRHWGKFVEQFTQCFPDAKVSLLDLPGTGTERHRSPCYHMDAIVDDLRRRFLALSPQPPTALLGISLGGMVAMQWCARHPEDFQRLVLINSSAANLMPPWRRMQPRVMLDFLRLLRTQNSTERERIILNFSCNHALQADPSMLEHWAALHRQTPIPLNHTIAQILAAIVFKAPKRLAMPILVATSQQDKLTHPNCSWALARRFDAELICHPSAGHDIPLDAPAWLINNIDQWLKAQASKER